MPGGVFWFCPFHAPRLMSEPVTGPPSWLVRTFVVLAILGVLLEIATYSGVFGGGLDSVSSSVETNNVGNP